MKVNTLVRHTRRGFEGIGCIAKVLKTKVHVNHGANGVMVCSPSALKEVDTSKCKEIKWSKFRTQVVANTCPDYAIIGNELKHWVGIGYVHHKVVTEEDLKKYPRIVD